MARTIADVEADIVTVNTALSELIAGNRIESFTIRNADFQRTYQNQVVTEEFLLKWRDLLYQELAALTAQESGVGMKFRAQTTIPLNVTKFGASF